MDITPEMKEAARKYVREGEVFKPLAGGEGIHHLGGTLLGITEGSSPYAYTLYLNAGEAGEVVDIIALSLTDEEARDTLSKIVGVIALPDFPKYPRFTLSVPDLYRTIEVRYYTRRSSGRYVGILAPTDITSKEVLTAAYRLINTALLREKYPLTAGA